MRRFDPLANAIAQELPVRVRRVPVDASLPAAATWVAWKEIQIYQ